MKNAMTAALQVDGHSLLALKSDLHSVKIDGKVYLQIEANKFDQYGDLQENLGKHLKRIQDSLVECEQNVENFEQRIVEEIEKALLKQASDRSLGFQNKKMELDGREKELDRREKDLQDQEIQIMAGEMDLNNCEENLKQALLEKERQVSLLETQVSSLQKELQGLQDALLEKETQVSSLETQVSSLQKEHDGLLLDVSGASTQEL